MNGPRARKPRPHSSNASPSSADRSWNQSAFRSPTPISRRSCSASATSIRIRRSSIFPEHRPASSPSSSPSAALPIRGSRSSGRATSPMTTSSTMGDQMLGMVTAHDYSASHDSALNKKYVEEFKKANNFRPNFVSVGGYDGMHLIYEALKKTGGKT